MISQLSNEINGLYRVVSSRTSTPGAKMIYKPAAIENTVEELLSGIVDAPNTAQARQVFDTLFEERINSLNSLDVLKCIVRELCVSVLRGGTMNRSEENVEPQTPHSFVSASLASASESVISASQERRHQSMLGTVRLPRANSDENLADLDSRSSNSGSDVPSQTTSDDDGSSDSDSDEVGKHQAIEGWRDALALPANSQIYINSTNSPTHLDLLQSLSSKTDGVATRLQPLEPSASGTAAKSAPKKATMPLGGKKLSSAHFTPKQQKNTQQKNMVGPTQGVRTKGEVRTRVGERRVKRTNTTVQNKRAIYKKVAKGYLFEILKTISSQFLRHISSPPSNVPVSIFTEDMCESVSEIVASRFGLSSDVYAETEVIYPVLYMFIGSALDQQTVGVMEEMIGSSLKQYECTDLEDGDDHQDVSHEKYYANGSFNDSNSEDMDKNDDEAENGEGYDSPNDISPQNLHKTLHSILCEEKEKKNSLLKSSLSPNTSGSHAIAAWDMQKSPMDKIFRQRFGGIDKPEICEVYDEFDDVESDAGSGQDNALTISQESVPVPAWEIPKSPLDHLFRKRLSGIDEPELDSLNAIEEVPPAWEIPKSPYDGVFRKCHGGLSGSPLKFEGHEYEKPSEEDVPAWSLSKSPLDSVFRKRVGGLGDSPSGVIDAQTGEFIPGKDFPPEEFDGEIGIDDLPPNFGMSLRLHHQFVDSESEDGLQDIDVNGDAGSTDSEYRPGNLLSFDGRIDKNVLTLSSQRDVVSAKQRKNVKGKKKVKRKKRELKAMSAADIALTSAWNALISPHSNFLKLEKSMTKTAASKTQSATSKSSINITVPTASKKKREKLKTRIATRRNNNSDGPIFDNQLKVEDGMQKYPSVRTTRIPSASFDRLTNNSFSMKVKAPVTCSTIRRQQRKTSNILSSKVTSSESTTLNKHRQTSSSAPSRSSLNEPVLSSKGESQLHSRSSTIPKRTNSGLTADGLILAKDDIDPRHHPVVISQQTKVLNLSNSRAGNSNYFEVYGVCEDTDSDESEEDCNPFAGEEDLDLVWRSRAFSMPIHGMGDTKNYSTFGNSK